VKRGVFFHAHHTQLFGCLSIGNRMVACQVRKTGEGAGEAPLHSSSETTPFPCQSAATLTLFNSAGMLEFDVSYRSQATTTQTFSKSYDEPRP
jgi:hypothetical protein